MSSAIQRIRDWMDAALGQGGGNANYVMIGVLSLIIVGAVALTILGLSGTLDGSSDSMEVRFKCLETGAEFTFERGNLPEGWEATAVPAADGTMLLKNRKTGRNTVVLMQRCPSCRGFYVSPSGTPFSVCPLCQTDITKWRRGSRAR